MSPNASAAFGWALRALALLPLFLAAWHFASPALGRVPARIAAPAIAAAAGEARLAAFEGATAVYQVRLHGPYRPGGEARAEAEFEVETGRYTFGLALYLALSFAAPQSRRLRRVLGGCMLLALLPAWGIAFDALRQLGQMPQAPLLLDWSATMREAVALGYQAGSLLLPALAPAALWLALNMDAWAPPPLPA